MLTFLAMGNKGQIALMLKCEANFSRVLQRRGLYKLSFYRSFDVRTASGAAGLERFDRPLKLTGRSRGAGVS